MVGLGENKELQDTKLSDKIENIRIINKVAEKLPQNLDKVCKDIIAGN